MLWYPVPRIVGARAHPTGVIYTQAEICQIGGVAELADAGDLKSSTERYAGSNPAAPTKQHLCR